MGKRIVFYSWQSDLPNSTNRGFIEGALRKAAQSLLDEGFLEVEPVIDRDTLGVPGSPDISETIFRKIDECDVFACDLSIVNPGADARETPNPNVLLELGYALKAIKDGSLLLIMNTAYGGPEKLPFDLRRKRITTYYLKDSDPEKSPVRRELESTFSVALKLIFEEIHKTESKKAALLPERSPVELLLQDIFDQSRRPSLDKLIRAETDKRLPALHIDNYPLGEPYPDGKAIQERLERYEKDVSILMELIINGCRYGSPNHDELWVRMIRGAGRFLKAQWREGRVYDVWDQAKYYPALLLLYSGCLSAMCTRKFGVMRSLLADTRFERLTNNGSSYETVNESGQFNLNPRFVVPSDAARSLPGHERSQYPLSEYLQQRLKPFFLEIALDEEDYRKQFDQLEYFLALNYLDITRDRQSGGLPLGCFVWRNLYNHAIDEFQSGFFNSGGTETILQCGFFGGSPERLSRARGTLDDLIKRAV